MQRTWTVAAIAAFAIVASAAAGQGGRDQSTSTTSTTRAERSSGDRGEPREFINTMAIAGMAEVQLGKIAAERGHDPDVKAFGQMMVTDHTKADEQLKQVASQAGVQLPTQLDEKHQELADRLMKLQGDAFDREYMKAMVEGHDDVHEQLLRQAGWTGRSTRNDSSVPSAVGTSGSTSGDSGVRQWAMKALPVVQQHLQRAREIREKVEHGR
jgi:putative membrane protein